MMLASSLRSISRPKRLPVTNFPFIICHLLIELQHAFKCYDVDKNGTMDMSEFKQVLKDLGKRDVTEEQVTKMMAEHDQNKDHTLSWSEFLEVWEYKFSQ